MLNKRLFVILLAFAVLMVTSSIVWRRTAWQRGFARHKAQLASEPWTGARPLYLLFGDSQVEAGKWDLLCPGAFGVRNCAHWGTKVRHVQELVSASPDRDVEGILLMCGINNIGRGNSVESTLEDFKALLTAAREKFQPKRIVVAAVMPIRQKDDETRHINANIVEFNRHLQRFCLDSKAIFVDIATLTANAEGGLSEQLTTDGLHLNDKGYRTIAPPLCQALTQK